MHPLRLNAPFRGDMLKCPFCACASTVNVLKPSGETATVTFRNSSKYQVEVLAISDSTIYVREESRIGTIRLSSVKKVRIHGYRTSPGLKTLSAIPALLIETIVLSAAKSVGQTGWVVISGLTIAGTVYAFSTGDPKVDFSAPLKESDVENLRLYCRYPQGLSDGQWSLLLKHHNQESFIDLSSR